MPAGPLLPGSQLGRFRIDALIATGRSGPLYRATLASLQRPVALKLIASEIAARPGYRERFLDRWRIAASLDHPGVVPVHDAGEDEDGRLFVAMRWVDGADLAAQGALEPARAARLVAQAARALDAAHERGLVHAGLRAADLLIAGHGEDEHVYVAGFHAEPGTTADGAPRPDLLALMALIAGATRGSALVEVLAPERRTALPSGRALAAAALAAVPATPATPDPPARATAPRRRALAAVIAVIGAAVVAVLAWRSAEPPAVSAGTVRPPPIEVVDSPWGIALGGGRIWVASAGRNTVTRLDPRTRRPVGAPIPVGRHPQAVAHGAGAVWVANAWDDSVTRIDAATGRVIGPPIAVGDEPAALAVGAGAVWTLDVAGGTVTRIDPGRARVSRPAIVIGPAAPAGDLAFAAGRLWVTEMQEGTVSVIDPATRRVVGRPILVGRGPVSLAGGDDALWVANFGDGTVVRIDPRTRRVVGRPVRVGGRPQAVAATSRVVWVTNENKTVTRIDPATHSIVGRPLPVGDDPYSIVIGASDVWVANYDSSTLTRIAPAAGENS